MLFIIYINDIVKDLESDIFIFADDTTLSCSHKNATKTSEILNRDLNRISIWSKKWKVTFQPSKTKFILFSQNKVDLVPPLTFDDKVIKQVNSHKHLGFYLTYNLDWSEQLNYVCLKANQRLGVLRHVRFLNRSTLDLLYKLTVRSVLDYGLQIYYNTLKLTEKNRLDRIQYSAAKLVTGTLHTTSKIKLNQELGWETISDRANYLGITLFHKIHKNETRPLIKTNMQQWDIGSTNTRSGGKYIPFKYKSLSYNNSFFPHFTKQWNLLSKKQKCLSLSDFKNEIKEILKPPKYKHLGRGNKYACSLLTQIRVGNSFLKSDSFRTGHSETNICTCGHIEDAKHYFTKCHLFNEQRQKLFTHMENYLPNFRILCAKRQLEILLLGYEFKNPEMTKINTKIMIISQNYILQTKRFVYKN